MLQLVYHHHQGWVYLFTSATLHITVYEFCFSKTALTDSRDEEQTTECFDLNISETDEPQKVQNVLNIFKKSTQIHLFIDLFICIFWFQCFKCCDFYFVSSTIIIQTAVSASSINISLRDINSQHNVKTSTTCVSPSLNTHTHTHTHTCTHTRAHTHTRTHTHTHTHTLMAVL